MFTVTKSLIHGKCSYESERTNDLMEAVERAERVAPDYTIVSIWEDPQGVTPLARWQNGVQVRLCD